MKKILLLTLISLLFGFYPCFGQKTFKPKKLKEDFDYAVQELKLQHQGFYNHLSKEETDAELNRLREELDAPMTRLEFYRIMRKVLGLMNEGHGSVDLPKVEMIKVGLSKSFLPVAITHLAGEWIVTQNFGEEVEFLSKGVKLSAINGEPIETVLEKLLPLIPTDGFNETSRLEWVGSLSFSLLYRLVYGVHREFELEIIPAPGEDSKFVRIPAVRFTAFKAKNALFPGRKFQYTDFYFEQINDSIAYLSVPDFGDGEMDYAAFYESKFSQVASLNIKHLIIDVQDNGGGEEGNENLLFSYLTEERIRKYRQVSMLPKPYEKNKDSKGYQFDKWVLQGSLAERGDFTLYSDYYSELGYEAPRSEHVYKGKLYVLISGETFSGGAEFSSLVKMTGRGVFIGEETGGTYEGNVSGYGEIVKLPNTKIKLDIPTVHFKIDVSPELPGRGVLPDYEVPQTWGDYSNSLNAKLEYVKRLIME